MSTPVTADDLKKKFQLGYQINALQDFDAWVQFRGKDILEVGGALPDGLVRAHYGARTWTAIDDTTSYNLTKGGTSPTMPEMGEDLANARFEPSTWSVYNGQIQDLPSTLHGRFDVVVSIATLEHVNHMSTCLDAIKAALKPSGVFCGLVGPIWSGYRGFHIYDHYFPAWPEDTQKLLTALPPWSHLAWNRPEMYAHLRKTFRPAYADTVVSAIYESPRLNRLFAEEYLAYFETHGLTSRRLDTWPTDPSIDRALLPQARARYPNYEHFEWDGFTCALEIS